MDNRSLIDDLIDVLPTEKSSAVTQSYLSDILHVSKRNVRFAVQQARRMGHSICSTPYDGYWLSESTEDILETISVLNAQAQTISDTIYFMRKILDGSKEV